MMSETISEFGKPHIETASEGSSESDYAVNISDKPKDKGLLVGLEKSNSPRTGSWVLLVDGTSVGKDGELGALLMKNFFHALLSYEQLPQAAVFINEGVFLTCLDSPVLDCLNSLAAGGMAVVSCCTSLEFYKLRMKHCTGSSVGMHNILDLLSSASKVVTL